MRGESCFNSKAFFCYKSLVEFWQCLRQMLVKGLHQKSDFVRLLVENISPALLKHHKYQCPKRIFFGLYVTQKSHSNEVHSLTVADFWVIRCVSLKHVVESIFA